MIAENDNRQRPVPLFGNRVVDLVGNSLKRIPKQKAALWASHEWPVAFGRVLASGSLSYTGDYSSSQLDRELDRVPARTRVDLRLSWLNEDGSLRVSAFVDNVFDAANLRTIGTGDHNSFYRLTGDLLYPRYWGIDVRRTFGS